MAKPFLTYQQQIQKLIDDKHLIIHDIESAEQKLQDIGYFTLIGGYKIPFRNPDTALHKKLCIPKTGTQYIMGKKDLFSVIITFRYMLSKTDFIIFKRKLAKMIEKYVRKSQRISESTLLGLMGFPSNWKKISQYKIR